jgi:hypothetical protein
MAARGLLCFAAMRIPILILLSLLATFPAVADLINPLTSANRLLIPVAGDTPGANGTHFRSDITIVNLRNVEQRVVLRWFAQGGSGSPDGSAPMRTLTIGPRSGITSENFVRNVMFQEGVGSIEVTGANDDGTPAQLHVAARIWTPQPNVPNGEMSQSFPALVFDQTPVQVKWILGMRRDANHRLNVGVVNTSTSTQQYRISVVSLATGTPSEVIDVTLGPLSMRQVLTTGTDAVAQIIVQNVSAAQTTWWHAWASTVNNVTGDAWSQMAFPAPAVAP